MKVQIPIYLQVKVEVEYDASTMTREEAVQEATSSFDYNFKLNKDITPINVVDTEIQEIMDLSYD